MVSGGEGGGGVIDLVLRGEGGERYPVGLVEVTGLASAPGAAVEVAVELELMGEVMGDFAGEPLSSFYGGGAPDELRPFVALDKIVRDPSNPNNLSNVLRGTAPVLLEVGEYDADMTDRLYGKFGVAGQLRAMRMGMEEAVRRGGLERAGGLGRMDILPIANLTELSALMQQQCRAAAATDPNGPAGRAKAGFGYATAAVGLMGPVGAAFALGAGVTSFVLDTYQQGEAALLPSEVVTYELLLSKSEFTEDFCETASWEVKISARNQGWSLDKTLVQGLFTAASAARGVKGLAGEVASREPLRRLSNDLADGVETVGGQALNEMFPGDASVFRIDPREWDGIEVTDGDFGLVEVSYPGGVVKEAMGSQRFFEPAQVGSGGVKVVMNPGILGCAASRGKTELVDVLENTISVSPNGGQVEPGQVLEFTATITDAYHKELEWGVTGGTLMSQSSDAASGVSTMVWMAPMEEDFPPATVRVWSPTQFCLREGVVRERVVTIFPKVSNLVLTPGVACVQSGGTQSFTVVKSDLTAVEEDLVWSIEGPGSLNPDGVSAHFTAGGDGVVTVRVHPVGDPASVLEETFNVGTCYTGSVTLVDVLPVEGWSSGPVNASLILSDAENPDALWLMESYYLVGSLYLSNSTDRLTGTYAAMGIASLIDEELVTSPETYDDGSRTFETSDGDAIFELTLEPRWGFDTSVEGVMPVEVAGEGRLLVRFEGNSAVVGSWTTDVELARQEWEFSDGARYTGDRIEHVFDVGPRFEHWVRVTVVDTVGHSATRTTRLRLMDMVTEFDTGFIPGEMNNCFDFGFPIPGFDPDCSGLFRSYGGPHAGDASMNAISVAPIPENPALYGIQISF
jgi:hypothetical protein